MAKTDYPGLVLVPPSDRSILKRRLAKWALLIVSVIGGISLLNFWLPSSDLAHDCQHGAVTENTSPLSQDCTHTAQAIPEAPSPRQEMIASQQATMITSEPAGPTQPPVEQPPAQQKLGQATATPPADLGSNSPNRMVASSQEDESAAGLINPSPVTSPTPAPANPDVRLAEQGDAFAQYRLGRYYAQQSGSHSPESVSWYMKASDGLHRLASTGNGKAMYVLGVMYAFGRGVVQNREEARSWLVQALAHQVPAAGPVLANLDKYRPADPNPPVSGQAKRPQT